MRLLALTALAGCSFSGAPINGDAAPRDTPASGDASSGNDGVPMTDAAMQVDAAIQVDGSVPPMCTTTYPMVSPAGHHYKVLANKTWDAGKTGCNDMGHLAKIDDSTENQYVAGLTSGYYWIGLKDVVSNDVYKWTDGTGLTFNGFGGPAPASSDDCVDADGSGTWSPFSCTFQHAAICECE